MNPILEHNRRVWDERVRQNARFTAPASEEDFRNPYKLLDGANWLGGNVAGQTVLCLGAGGAKHGPLLASQNAQVTVVDISAEMLQLDRQCATERKLTLELVQASIDDLSALPQSHYDLVIQPVSTCYVPDIRHAYREVARVIKPDGIYISRHKQPINLQTGLVPSPNGFSIRESYYTNGPLSPDAQSGPQRESGTLEFLHRWGDLLGGLCQAGFVIEDVAEPRFGQPDAKPGTFEYRGQFIPPYIQIKARRSAKPIWTP